MSALCSRINALSHAHSNIFKEGLILAQNEDPDWDLFTQKVINNLKDSSSNTEKKNQIQSILYEIVLLSSGSNTQRPLDSGKVVQLIKDMHAVEGAKTARLLSSLINSFPEKSEKLVDIVKSLDFMDSELCTYIMDDKLLERTAKFTVKERALFKKSLLDTRYIIQKYNLLSEHPIGFSELITLLVIAYSDPTSAERARAYWQEACSIIGKYSLDPLRALDVVFMVSSRYITKGYPFLLKFLKESDYWPTTEADHSSIENLHMGGNMIASQLLSMHLNEPKADVTFYDMTCLLVRANFISFSSIFENLGPDEDQIQKFTDQYFADMEQDSMKGVSNPLAMAAALADDSEESENPATTDSQKHDDQKEELSDEEKKARIKREQDEILGRGKMYFMQRLLAHGVFIPFFSAFGRYQRFFLTSPELLKLYLKLFDHIITPIYEAMVYPNASRQTATEKQNLLATHTAPLLFGMKSGSEFYFTNRMQELPQVDSIEQLIKVSHEWLSILGPHVAHDPVIVSKLCKIGLKDIEKSCRSSEALSTWLNFTRKFIFVSLPLLMDNLVVINEVFVLLQNFDFEKRYFLYNEMISKTSQDNVFVKAKWNESSREAKSALKSLSNDNIGEKGRFVAKLISKNPLSTLEPVMNQLENYDKVSDLVVETSLYYSPYAYDVLQYAIILRLASGRQALQDNGVYVTMWVQRLAFFIASLAKHSPRMDIGNIIQLIVKKLHNGDMIAVTVIKELTSRVSGVKSINDLSPKQLVMLNSGQPLQESARAIIRDTRSENEGPASRLLNIFIEQQSLSETIILLYNMQSSMIDADLHYKVLSSRIDEISLLLWSFIDMSKYFLGFEKFSKNVVSFEKLIDQYGVSMEWVFLIWRDCYDSCANQGTQAEREFREIIQRPSFVPKEFQNGSSSLFTDFWRLSLYDLCFEKDLYDEEKYQLERSLQQLKLGKKKRETSKMLENVMSSRIAHQMAHNKCVNKLREQSMNLDQLKASEVLKPFLQSCLIPRVLFSPSDALYTVNFIWESFAVSGSLAVLEELVTARVLIALLFSSTSLEASNLGLFFVTLLEKFEVLRKSNKLTNDDLKRIYVIQTIIVNDVIDLISEKNYMSIRNGIEFMKYLSTVFPVVKEHILQVIQAIEKLISIDEREDIQLPSNALIGHLKARLKYSLKLEDFYQMSEEDRRLHRVEEKEEIARYERAIHEEQEEARLKQISERDIEDNKKRMDEQKLRVGDDEHSQTAYGARIRKEPSLPMHEVLNEMTDVLKCLETTGTSYLNRHIRNRSVLTELRQIEQGTARRPREYKARLADLFESYFMNLTSSPNNEKFKHCLSDIMKACRSIVNPHTIEKSQPGRRQAAIAYDDEVLPKVQAPKRIGAKPTVEETKRTSRYEGSSEKKPSKAISRPHLNEKEYQDDKSGPNATRGAKSHNLGSSNRTGSRYDPSSSSRLEDSGMLNRAQSPIPRGTTQSTYSADRGSARSNASLPKGKILSVKGNPGSVTSEKESSSRKIPLGDDRGRSLKFQTSEKPNIRSAAAFGSRYEASPNQIQVGERRKIGGSSQEVLKRSRDESPNTYPSKRAKQESDQNRDKFEGRSFGRRDNNYRDRYSGKHNDSTSERRTDKYSSTPSPGLRGQDLRQSKPSQTSQGGQIPKAPESRYRK
ncbi:LAQU0S05e03026g1_1 [Lachancea quebecensis]|uniref:THO complex subunit 2 n=1 Tax=Lachancea quebecensis TaxID=1654605 RepID=A0A0P1KRL1_9SACH|nr:LAQU0S05e03026g1_1 [Lachancea quebecensis]